MLVLHISPFVVYHYEWIKDIVDKCVELCIPLKMQPDLRPIVAAKRYDFFEQESAQ